MIHLVPLEDWTARSDEPYAPPSLADEGFIHCAADVSVALAVANAFYRQAPRPLLALFLDEAAVSARVAWEAPAPLGPLDVPDGTLFPHIYGPLNRSAVQEIRETAWDASGQAIGFIAR